jgi:hypothetical protein
MGDSVAHVRIRHDKHNVHMSGLDGNVRSQPEPRRGAHQQTDVVTNCRLESGSVPASPLAGSLWHCTDYNTTKRCLVIFSPVVLDLGILGRIGPAQFAVPPTRILLPLEAT